MLGRDDVFGERGLIGRSPRTATITATSAGRLFAMDGEAFMALVSSRRGAAERFLALYDVPESPARR
jgi:CRP-like cAMP-binding protein